MTYSDWREELILTEGAKTRFIIKSLKKLKGIIKKPKRNIFPIGSTKASGRLNVDPELIAQFPGVNIRKLAYPDYKAPRNPKLAKAIKIAKDKLDRGKNPKFKGGSPYSTDVPPAIPNVRAPIPPKLSKDIKANLSKGTKLTDDQKKKNFADYIKSLRKKVKDKNKKNKNLKTYEGDDKYYPPEIGESAIAIKGGSKLIPALMTGIGAAGMIMQSKKSKGPFADTGGFDASKSRTKRQYLGLPPSSDLTKQQKKNRKIKGQQEILKKRDDKIATEGPGDLVPGAKRERLKKLLKKYLEKSGVKAKRDANKKIDRNLDKKVDESVAAPTNNASSGAIAGLPPDNPPVKKKKRYIYGGTGSRKMWMNNK